jgi:hypothetical protein
LFALFAYPVGLTAPCIATFASWYQIEYVIGSAGVALDEVVCFGCSRYSTPMAWRVVGQ